MSASRWRASPPSAVQSAPGATRPGPSAEILDRSREVGGDRALLVLGDERVSHVEHHDRVMRLAAALVDELGVRPGDRVAIATRNLPEWSIAFFAAVVVGAIAAPLNAFWNGAEMAFAPRGLRCPASSSPTASDSSA